MTGTETGSVLDTTCLNCRAVLSGAGAGARHPHAGGARGRRGRDRVPAEILQALPRALFVLIPALAGILGLFYGRQPYPDHLYFAIHLQAFAFLVMTIPAFVQYTGSVTWLGVTQAGAYVATAVYLVAAAHRVYGGGWLENLAKALGVVVLYLSI